MNCTEEMLTSEKIYSGKIMEVYNDTVKLPDGSEATREYVHHTGGCSILAVDGDQNIYLVEQFRYPYHEMLMEIPAGKLNADEDPKECAIRELREEVGLRANSIEEFGVYYPTPAYTDEPLHVFLTTDFIVGESKLDPQEFLNVRKFPLSDVLDMIEKNEIKDAKTVISVTRYALTLFKKVLRAQNFDKE
ncbi:MAG: NUDIX hydrolase [Clostridia bacterium]